jgi:hypothetical protein
MDRFFELVKVLASERDPFLPIFDQEIPLSGKAGTISFEICGELIVAG